MPKSCIEEHMRLRQYIVNMAMRSETDVAIPTERELAAMFGVARGTIRRTLEHMVLANFLTKVPRRGYFVNHNAGIKYIRDKKLVGILLINGGLPFFEAEAARVMRVFLEQAERLKFNVEMVFVSDLDRLSEELAESRLDGLFWWGVSDNNISQFEKIDASGLPVVAVCTGKHQPFCGHYIWLDHAREIYAQFEYLLSRRAKRIAHITTVDKKRFISGCKRIFKKYNVPFCQELFMHDSEFKEKFPAILKNIDAVICRLDQADVIREMADEHDIRIPEDLQLITGFRNTDWRPTMSCKPHHEIISLATDKLVELMDGNNGDFLNKTDFDWNMVKGVTTKEKVRGMVQ